MTPRWTSGGERTLVREVAVVNNARLDISTFFHWTIERNCHLMYMVAPFHIPNIT